MADKDDPTKSVTVRATYDAPSLPVDQLRALEPMPKPVVRSDGKAVVASRRGPAADTASASSSAPTTSW
jgi:hypothetical protein